MKIPVANYRILVHNKAVIIIYMIRGNIFIRKTNENNKEREYVRENVQTQREQHNR